MVPLLVGWLLATIILVGLLIAKRRLESREVDWLPLATTTSKDIRNQQLIEQKLHWLDPVLHWAEALDVLLLLSLITLWVYQGLNTVRW